MLLEEMIFMGSILKKYGKNNFKNNLNIKLNMKFVCNKCNTYKIYTREEINTIKPEDYQTDKRFFCDKCNSRLIPTEVIADY